MEIPINHNMQSRLTRIASERGSAVESVALEALERFLDYDTWFISEVNKGIAATERGDLIDHEEVLRQVDTWLLD